MRCKYRSMIRDARPEDLGDIVALVRDLAEYERAPQEVVLDADEFARHVLGDDAVAHVLIADMGNGSVGGLRSGTEPSRRGSGATASGSRICSCDPSTGARDSGAK